MSGSARTVDPWRFAGGFLKKVLSAGIPEEPSHEPIPWTRVSKPLSASRVALLTTAGVSMQGEPPFDMDLERKNPMRGDPSWRALRADATARDVEVNHLHIDTGPIRRDLNVALPLDRLRELAEAGEIGEVAPTHYSTMGYQGNDRTSQALQSAPEIAARMVREEVDLALLAPV